MIDYVPGPLRDDLVRGRWFPVIGAGFSLNAIAPPGESMPDWKSLGTALASENGAYEATGPIDAISAYDARFGRPRLVERLSQALLVGRATPGSAHRELCAMPFEVVLTTNLEFLLEQQYASLARPCHPVLDETQLAVANPYAGPTLIKLHGDVHHPARLVVTEDDYDGFLNRNPMMATYVTSLLLTKVPILIGYSLDDPDFRQLLAIMHDRLGSHHPQPWAVTLDADPSLVARYERRGVRVLNLLCGRLSKGEALAQLFRELKEHWLREIPSVTTSSSTAVLDLALVPENDVCVLSVPQRLSRFYLDVVFPAIEAVGLNPVTPEVLDAPPGSSIAALQSLVESAAVVIIDVGDGTGWFDLSLVREGRALPVVLIGSAAGHLPADLAANPVIMRPVDPSDDDGEFLTALQETLRGLAENLRAAERTRPERLLEVGESGHALVAAFATLEGQLRTRWGLDSGRDRPRGLPEMLRVLVTEALLTPDEQAQLLDAWRLRNEVVHKGQDVPARSARGFVTLIMDVSNRVESGRNR